MFMNEYTANLLSKTYLECNLPKYVQHDIEQLIVGREKNSSLLDCMECELQASINSAEVDLVISTLQAMYLRAKYLYYRYDENGLI